MKGKITLPGTHVTKELRRLSIGDMTDGLAEARAGSPSKHVLASFRGLLTSGSSDGALGFRIAGTLAQ